MDHRENKVIIVRGPIGITGTVKGSVQHALCCPALLPGVGKVPVELQPAAVQLARPGHARCQRGVKQYILPLAV